MYATIFTLVSMVTVLSQTTGLLVTFTTLAGLFFLVNLVLDARQIGETVKAETLVIADRAEVQPISSNPYAD